MKYVYDNNNLSVVDNPLPKVYITNAYIIAKNGSESLDFLTKESMDPKVAVVESDNPNFVTKKNTPEISTAKIEIYKPNYVRITTHALFDGILVLTDTNFPGWEAYVNGQKSSIYFANYLFRGIRLTAGTNIVEFKYQPAYLNTAFLLSGITIFMVLFLSAKKLLMR